MNIGNDMSDTAALEVLGQRIARYRLNRNLTQAALASEAGISLPTVQRLEGGHSTQATNLVRVLRALQLLDNLNSLVPEPAISPLQQAQMQGRTRQRASSPRSREPATPWTWDTSE